MSVVTFVSLLAVLGLVVIHLFSNRLRFLDDTPRSIWLSIAGGISVAYVFVHLLPELAEGQETVAEALDVGGEGLAPHLPDSALGPRSLLRPGAVRYFFAPPQTAGAQGRLHKRRRLLAAHLIVRRLKLPHRLPVPPQECHRPRRPPPVLRGDGPALCGQ